MRKLMIFGLVIWAASLMTPAAYAQIEGVTFPEQIRAGAQTLQLHGCGAREALFFDLYAAALYLPRAGLGQDEILAASTPKAVQLKILYGDLPDNIPQSWSEPLDRMVREELEQTVREIYANFESGDEVRIVYAPEMGARLIVNGAVRREMPDDDVFRPLLRLWIGEEAVSKNLRRLLLSGDCG